MKLLVADGGCDLFDGELGHFEVGGDGHRDVLVAPEQLELPRGLGNWKKDEMKNLLKPWLWAFHCEKKEKEIVE